MTERAEELLDYSIVYESVQLLPYLLLPSIFAIIHSWGVAFAGVKSASVAWRAVSGGWVWSDRETAGSTTTWYVLASGSPLLLPTLSPIPDSLLDSPPPPPPPRTAFLVRLRAGTT